jgi:hypothetical protein
LSQSGEPELIKESARLIEEISCYLDRDVAEPARWLLKAVMKTYSERLETIAGEDAVMLLTRQRKSFFLESEVLDGPRPWELTMTMRREGLLRESERADAMPDLKGYWDYQEGWETFDESCLEVELQQDIPQPYRRVLTKLIPFFKRPEFAREASLALRDFLCASGRKRIRTETPFHLFSREEVAFYDWALLSRPLSEQGHSPAREYLEQNGHDLWKDELDYLEALIASRLSLFEVLEIEPGCSLRVRDVFKGDIIPVRGEALTIDLDPSDAVIMRISGTQGDWEIMGPVFPVTGEAGEGIEKAAAVADILDLLMS